VPKIIDLVATGSGKDDHTLKRATHFIETMGFMPRVSSTIFGSHPLYVNNDELRLQNLVSALYAEDSDIIWCLRGGCGTTRLLPYLNKLSPPHKPKMVIGFSDVTALLLFLSQEWGWQVVHGPTASYATANKLTLEALDTLVQLIQRKAPKLYYDKLTPLNPTAQQSHAIEGVLTGGNLSLIEYSLATFWQIKSQGRITFFEDINEQGYRLAERLEHLRQAEIFQGVKAILFGDFSHEEPDKYRPDLIDFVLNDFACKTNIPCFKNLPVGHVNFCRPLMINAPAILTTGAEGSLTQYL
jgi:muramoyltetrapeptide carboxypeptidase